MKKFSTIAFLEDVIKTGDLLFVLDLYVNLSTQKEKSFLMEFQGITANEMLDRGYTCYIETMVDEENFVEKTVEDLKSFIKKKTFKIIKEESPLLLDEVLKSLKESEKNEKRTNKEVH